MTAAQKLANENNELQTSRESGDAAGGAGAASTNQPPVFEVYENPNPPAAAATRPQLEVVEGGAGDALQIPASTNPSILNQPNETVVWLHGISPAVRNELKQIFIAQKDRPLELQIQTQSSAEEIERQIEEQLALQVEGKYPALIREFVNKATLYSQQNKAPEINIVLMSKNTVEKTADEVLQADYEKEKEKLRKISGDQISTTIYSEKGATSTDHARAGLNLTLGTPGAKAGIDPQELLKKSLAAQEAQQDNPYVALILSSDVAGSVDAVSMKGYAHGKLEGKAAAAAPSDSGVDEKMAQRQLSLETYAAATRHPDADEKTKRSIVRQIEKAVGEVDSELSDSSLAAQLNITDALRNLTRAEEEHPVMQAAGPRMDKISAKAADLAGDVEQVAPAAILKELGRTPSAEAKPVEPKRLAALTASRIKQLQKLSENPDVEIADMAELVDDRLLDALKDQPGFAALAETLAKAVGPIRRMAQDREANAELQGLGAEELKILDPKGALKLDGKAQDTLRALAEKLKADPKLRAELAQNKDMAAMLDALDATDFDKPADIAKLAAQIAKLPAEARAELAKTSPAFAEVAQQVTAAVAMDALSAQLDGLDLKPEQRQALDAIIQKMGDAADPEALKEIAQELGALAAEMPELKAFAEIAQKVAAEPAAMEKFAAQHAESKIENIERVEAVHLHADVSAKLEFTLGAMKDGPATEAQQQQVQQLAVQLSQIDTAPKQQAQIEFPPSALAAMQQFQAALKADAGATELPFSPVQMAMLSHADLSDPKAQQQVAAILNQAPQSNQPSDVATKLNEALKDPNIGALKIAQQIQGMGNGQTGVSGVTANPNPAPAQPIAPPISIPLTMPGAAILALANDPSQPESVRNYAYQQYLQKITQEQVAKLTQQAQQSLPPQQRQQMQQDLQQAGQMAAAKQQELARAAQVNHVVEANAAKIDTTPKADNASTASAPEVKIGLDKEENTAPSGLSKNDDLRVRAILEAQNFERPVIQNPATGMDMMSGAQPKAIEPTVLKVQEFVAPVTFAKSQVEELVPVCPVTGARGKCLRYETKEYSSAAVHPEIEKAMRELSPLEADALKAKIQNYESGNYTPSLIPDNAKRNDETFMCSPEKCGTCPHKDVCPKSRFVTLERMLADQGVVSVAGANDNAVKLPDPREIQTAKGQIISGAQGQSFAKYKMTAGFALNAA